MICALRLKRKQFYSRKHGIIAAGVLILPVFSRVNSGFSGFCAILARFGDPFWDPVWGLFCDLLSKMRYEQIRFAHFCSYAGWGPFMSVSVHGKYAKNEDVRKRAWKRGVVPCGRAGSASNS